MASPPPPSGNASHDALRLCLRALSEVAGAAVVLDPELRIVAFTEPAPALVGGPIPIGVNAAKVLCGTGEVRPVAEALSRGDAVTAEVERPLTDGSLRFITVRAAPLRRESGLDGWLLLLDENPFTRRRAGEAEVTESYGIMTRDPAMQHLLRQIVKVARSKANVLVRGETGAGKELVAQALHRASARSSGPFRALNCAALPPSLLESELFGHVRGAFTGAIRDNPGYFRLADGGTLFLDEVGELPLEVQAKLLRVLQERVVVPVGGQQVIPVDVRIVAATHRSLRAAVKAHRFRADLLYRLRVIPLFLPPLRDRPLDVEPLAWRFISELQQDAQRTISGISPGAMQALLDYRWPGNVRELRNVIEYALVMGEGPLLTEADLPAEVANQAAHKDHGKEINQSQLGMDGSLPRQGNVENPTAEPQLPLEARKLLTALERAGGHHGRAAQSLGMSRVTLWRKLRKWGLVSDEHPRNE